MREVLDQIGSAVARALASSSDKSLKEQNIFITRLDGVMIYHQKPSYDENSDVASMSLGVLACGLWQAACETQKIYTDKQAESGHEGMFRLTFDSVSEEGQEGGRGLCLLPLLLRGGDYLLGMVYTAQMNPAKIKHYFRLLKEELEKYFASSLAKEKMLMTPPSISGDNQKKLFTHLSDEEIDDLFAFSEV